MKNKIVSLAFVGIVMLAISACSRSNHKTVTLAGSTAFQPFAEKLAEHYLAMNKEIKINVQGGGSAVGIQSALSGAADIGMADLLTLPEEAKALTSTTVARDGIAIIVNPKNSVGGITSKQAREIFNGTIKNWKEVGGLDAPIRIVSREEGSGTRRSFDKMVLGTDKLAVDALFQNSNGTIREAVSSDSNAIGYLSIGLVNDKVKPLSYDGIAPANDNVKTGKYPLARPIFLLTRANTSQQAKEFIAYMLSGEAQTMLEKEGLIAVK